MKRTILLLTLILVGCNQKKMDLLNAEVNNLKHKNDSLTRLLDTLNTKFIFDESKMRIIPSENNTNKLGSDYNGEIVLIAHNKSDYALFSRNKNKAVLTNADTLKTTYGGYKFKTKFDSKEILLHYSVIIKNRISPKFGNDWLDNTIISEPKKSK